MVEDNYWISTRGIRGFSINVGFGLVMGKILVSMGDSALGLKREVVGMVWTWFGGWVRPLFWFCI